MIKPKTDKIIAKVSIYILIASVKLLSMTSTSRENRFVIRPSGVVSKKDMGARKVRVMARLSIFLLALVPMIVSDNAKENKNKTWVAPKAAYTPM